MNTGKIIFWTGFIITVGMILFYLILISIDVTCFTNWIGSLSLCGTVLVGSVLMLIGRALERRS